MRVETGAFIQRAGASAFLSSGARDIIYLDQASCYSLAVQESSRAVRQRSLAHLKSPGQSYHRVSALQRKEPLTLFELQEWLGHSSPESTRHYTKITPTKLAKLYQDAGYFARNLRAVEVLIDQDAVRRGSPPDEPWKLYDLGHGYCSYDFFDQCPHRMARARCDFTWRKESSRAQSIEAKANLLRLTQEIPLHEDELRAVEDGRRTREAGRKARILPDARFYMISENTAYLLSHCW